MMPSYQERVIAERDELKDKLSRLKPFLQGSTFITLPLDEQQLLAEQERLMTLYLDVLNKRIAKFHAVVTPL